MKSGHRPEIDGLRSVAILPVVIYHAGFSIGGVHLLPGGFLGVDIFFVISGYLITTILLAEQTRKWRSMLHFYERRARRILPALFLVLAVSSVLAWWLMTPPQMENFAASLGATVLYVSNFFFWVDTGYFSEAIDLKPLAHTWSLAVEEQFYLVFPALLILVRKRLSDRTMLGLFGLSFIASLLLAQWLSQAGDAANFYLLPSRAWELLGGAILALVERKRERPTSGAVPALISGISLVVLAASFVLIDAAAAHPGLVTLPLILATMGLIWCSGAGGPATALLTSKPAVAIGLVSYSLYLWHHPVLSFARLSSITDLTWLQRVALVGLSFVLAYLSWRFVERPFRIRDRIRASAIWKSAGAATLGAILFSGAALAADGWMSRMPPEYVALASIGRGYWNLKGEDCFKAHCVVGDKVTPSIAITGDSHSGMLAMSFDRALQGSGKSAWVVANGDVYVSSYPESYSAKGSSLDQILATNKETILANGIDTVVLSARAAARISNLVFDNGEGGVEQNPDPFVGRSEQGKADLKQAIREGILELLAAGKKVVLVYPVPEVGWNVPDTLAKLFASGKPPLTTSEARYLERNKDVFEVYDGIGDNPNLVRVYPERLFCSIAETGRCSVYDNGQVLYLDAHHLSVAGADRLVAAIISATKERWGAL